MAKSTSNNGTKSLINEENPYISCIRIHGLRILPPILTDEKRLKMQYYKELAIQVEQKIKNRKSNNILTSTIEDFQPVSRIDSNSSTNSSTSYSSDEEPTFRSQIFSESCKSDVLKMLNDNSKPAILKVPSTQNDSDIKCLEKDLPKFFSVSDTTILEVKTFESSPKTNESHSDRNSPETNESRCDRSSPKTNESHSDRSSSKTSESHSDRNLPETNEGHSDRSSPKTIESHSDKSSPKTNDNSDRTSPKTNGFLSFCEAGDANKIELEESADLSPTRLIRSNSYTIDTPSPFLLASMEKNNPERNIDSAGKRRRTWDLEKAKEKWSSIENDLNFVVDKTKNSKRDNFCSLPPSSNPSPEIRMFESHCIKRTDSIHYPEKENNSFKPEHSEKRRIRSGTPIKISKKTESTLKNPTEIILPKKPEILSEKSEKYIREVIDKINDEQTKLMAQLIARQKKEQENLMKFFAEQQAIVLSKFRNTYQDEKQEKSIGIIENIKEPDILKNSESLLSECKKILLQESLSLRSESSSQTIFSSTFGSPDDTLINDSLKSLTPSPEDMKSVTVVESVACLSRINTSFSVDSLEVVCNGSAQKNNRSGRAVACSRQLFPTKEQIWAASKINAFARGYLVRRLLKTDRVQNLIKTIKDTLVCAMELHHETVDNISPADVELHRRLIQQVTAACYNFHDTFFELPKSEQLQIIALDRQIQKDKLLRPASAKSNASLSSTTQKVLERKIRRRCSDSMTGSQSRSSSSRSCYSNNEFRIRTRSLGLSDSLPNGRKASPPNDMIRRSMNFGSNKKPWR